MGGETGPVEEHDGTGSLCTNLIQHRQGCSVPIRPGWIRVCSWWQCFIV